MSPLGAVLIALAMLLGTSLLTLLLARRERLAGAGAVLGIVVACGFGLFGSAEALALGQASELRAVWQVPGGALVVGIDALSAFFLVPMFALGALVAVFGRRYLAGHGGVHVATAGAVLALLLAAMTIVLVARHALLFLAAWESMTLLAYVLISADHAQLEVRRAGFTYLIASHVGVLALMGLFLVLGAQVGGAMDFASFRQLTGLSRETSLALLALVLVGFGIKAGVVGLHVWLPEAHAAAPSHVSALMSGILVKLGVYGMLRVLQLLPPLLGASTALMTLGLLGALAGIALALQQRDLKRVLAYSTIENVGIVLFGLGFGLWAKGRGAPSLAALGFGGSLLHVWNHCAIKGLLFLGAGSVLHATGSKDLERLGGLLQRMPVTGVSMLLGAVAIAGLPPLNGLLGEWAIYRGLASAALAASAWASLAPMAAIATLALVGGLATLCFVRLVGVALLGEPRSKSAREARESSWEIAGPLALLSAVCVALALAPALASRALAPLLGELCGTQGAETSLRAALEPLATANWVLFAALFVGASLLLLRTRAGARGETWGCAYSAPRSRMQYTATSFAELLADRLLPAALRSSQRESRPPRGLFPASMAWHARHEDPLTRAVYEPALTRWGDRFARLRWLQQGRLQIYLVYIAGAAVLGLSWSALRSWWAW